MRQIATDGITVGAHSETHPLLTALDFAERRKEIERSRAACETFVGKPIEGFAYPHGDHDAVTKTIVRDCGLGWACSTQHARIDRSGFDPFSLPRVQVLNWSASELERALDRTGSAA